MEKSRKDFWWLILIGVLVVTISILHYMTPTTEGHFHLIYMQAYFMPILIAAFQFGVRGGVITALMISLIYVPHIMLQWVGDTEHTLLGALQIIMFNIIGYLTGLKAQKENHEKVKYQVAANDLEKSLEKLRQQSNELADLEEQLRFSDRLAIVGELTSSLAHELRNPLGTIRGTVEILNEELPEDTKKTEFFQILVQETERMSAVVENYLNFARKQSEPASQYDVREIVNNTCLILASRARKEQINIQKYLPDNPIFLKGDPNDLRQILVNLLLNAIEAMSSPGQITLAAKLSVAKAKLVNSLEIENNPMVLQLSIEDQGPGMAQEEIANIFKPFYTTKKGGTGLGLGIVKRIADQHRWEIEVKSLPQEGTEFILSIPLTSSAKSSAQTQSSLLNQ